MNKDDAIKIISEHIDFLEMVINWEGIDNADILIEALKCITEDDRKMKKDAIKIFQINVRIYEEFVLSRFKEFLNSVNLHYTCIYNPIGQLWDVFINVEGEDMKKVAYSAIKLFFENEKYNRGGELYERMW